MTKQELLHIIKEFVPADKLTSSQKLTAGNINHTYLVEVDRASGTQKYILQNINTQIFNNPEALLNNCAVISKHIDQKLKENPKIYYQNFDIYQAKTGKYGIQYTQDSCWRLLDYIEGKPIENAALTQAHIIEGGKMLGRFHQLLSDLNTEAIVDTIPNFHHSDKYYDAFVKTVEQKPFRYKETADFCRKLDAYSHLIDVFVQIKKQNILPKRLVHNDPKLDNILFDHHGKACTLIDLDTCMQGYLPVDFGDAIRSITNTASENETDLNKVHFDSEKYLLYRDAYLSEVQSFVSEKEVEFLPFFIQLITYEQALRFYTDYLQNDIYYHTTYDRHNFNRARVQLKLLDEMTLFFSDN